MADAEAESTRPEDPVAAGIAPPVEPAGPWGVSPESWRRLLTGCVLGMLALLLAGVMPAVGAWALRAVPCGLVMGLSVRRLREVALAAGLSALSALAAIGVFVLTPGAARLPAIEGADVALALVTAMALAAVIGLVCAVGRVRIAVVVALALLLGIQLYQTGILPGEPREANAELVRMVATEPPTEGYQVDGDLYLKVDYLMARGTAFYPAFLQAFEEDKRSQGKPGGLFNIRQRWLFEAWNLVPGPPGLRVLYLFDVLGLATMLAGYALARRFVEPAAALVAPVALGGYLLFPALSIWFPLSEYWGGMVAVFFLYALVTERWTTAAALLVVAVAFRELMVFLVPVYVVGWLIERPRKGIPGLVAVIAGPAVLIGLHAVWAPVRGLSSAGISPWLHGSAERLLEALRFSGATVGASEWVYPVIPILAVLGALLVPRLSHRAALEAAVIVPVVALLVFSAGEFGYYWGAIAMPALLALAPVVAVRMVPAVTARAVPAVAATGTVDS